MNVKCWKKLLMGSEELAEYKQNRTESEQFLEVHFVLIEEIRVGE